MEQPRVPLLSPAALPRAVRKAEPRQRRHDHIEGVGRVPAETRRVGEHRDYLMEAVERVGPAVQEQDRHGMGTLAALVDEVDPETAYPRPKLRRPVELGLLLAPVEGVPPVVR
jgi:hypothetical protein